MGYEIRINEFSRCMIFVNYLHSCSLGGSLIASSPRVKLNIDYFDLKYLTSAITIKTQ